MLLKNTNSKLVLGQKSLLGENSFLPPTVLWIKVKSYKAFTDFIFIVSGPVEVSGLNKEIAKSEEVVITQLIFIGEVCLCVIPCSMQTFAGRKDKTWNHWNFVIVPSSESVVAPFWVKM